MRDIEVNDGLELVRLYGCLEKGIEKMEEENKYGVYDDDLEFLREKVEEIGNRRLITPEE